MNVFVLVICVYFGQFYTAFLNALLKKKRVAEEKERFRLLRFATHGGVYVNGENESKMKYTNTNENED